MRQRGLRRRVDVQPWVVVADDADLIDDHLLLALPPGHPLAAAPSVELADAAGERWVVGGIGGPCHEVGLAACAAAGFSPDVVQRVDDWGALLRLAARAGAGRSPCIAPVVDALRVVARAHAAPGPRGERRGRAGARPGPASAPRGSELRRSGRGRD